MTIWDTMSPSGFQTGSILYSQLSFLFKSIAQEVIIPCGRCKPFQKASLSSGGLQKLRAVRDSLHYKGTCHCLWMPGSRLCSWVLSIGGGVPPRRLECHYTLTGGYRAEHVLGSRLPAPGACSFLLWHFSNKWENCKTSTMNVPVPCRGS